MRSDRTADQEFEFLYSLYAAVGLVDEPGGSEYRRVQGEWETLGKPTPIGAFILVSANVGVVRSVVHRCDQGKQ